MRFSDADVLQERTPGENAKRAIELINSLRATLVAVANSSGGGDAARYYEAHGELEGILHRLGVRTMAANTLSDIGSIRTELARIEAALPEDPSVAIGKAKNLLEATAKIILTDLGHPVDEKADVRTVAVESAGAFRSRAHRATSRPVSREDQQPGPGHRRRCDHLPQPGRRWPPAGH